MNSAQLTRWAVDLPDHTLDGSMEGRSDVACLPALFDELEVGLVWEK